MSEPAFGFHVVLISKSSDQMVPVLVPPVLSREEVTHLLAVREWSAMISRHPELQRHLRTLRDLAPDWRVATAEEAARWLRVTEGRG